MEHFQYVDYKEFINHLVKSKEKSRGEFTRLAGALQVSTVLISQIFKAEKDLNSEQALKLTKYFGFTDLQTKYFLTCLSFNRAGDQALRDHYRKELHEIQARSMKISERVTSEQELSSEQKLIYYSSWKYAAVHLACALPFLKSEAELAEHLRLETEEMEGIVKFLLETGLLKKEYGDLQIGPTYIHVDRTSPYVSQHHKNWRLFSALRSSEIKEDEMMYTAPMVVSKEIALQIHEKLLEFIQKMAKSTENCPDEELWNLNIDYIRMK